MRSGSAGTGAQVQSAPRRVPYAHPPMWLSGTNCRYWQLIHTFRPSTVAQELGSGLSGLGMVDPLMVQVVPPMSMVAVIRSPMRWGWWAGMVSSMVMTQRPRAFLRAVSLPALARRWMVRMETPSVAAAWVVVMVVI